jgi:hypothetical protein
VFFFLLHFGYKDNFYAFIKAALKDEPEAKAVDKDCYYIKKI